jgi:beta-glucanase (GH16 family)
VLKIQDNDPYDRGLIDDFEGPLPPLETWGDVTLTTEEITAGMAMSLPTQGTYETVLAASYDIGAGETGGFMRPFFDAQDWSDFQGVDLWYYGANSGEDVTVTLYDNEAPDPGPSSWELVWSDEFNGAAGAAPDPTKWGYDIGGWGWGNNERQYYTDLRSNSAQDGNGSLVITATTENTATTTYDCHYGPCEYTSARLLTQDKFEFAYGRVEGRLKIPYSQGVWPAFWSLGDNFAEVSWPTCGEIDIMENIGREPTTTHGTVHGPGYAGGSGIGGSYTQTLPFHEDYHVFAIEWEPEEIRWYVDGNHFFTVTPDDLPSGTDWVFDHPFFLIMNIAVGGYWPGYPDETTVMPQTMHIDYMRVYQAPQSAERFEATFTDDATGWQHVMLPFDAFSRGATQPDGAPDDGLTLTAMQGYALELPEGSDTAYVDQVHLFGKHPLLDDYESGWSSEYVVWGDFEWNPGTTTALTPTLATFGPTDAMALPYQTYTNTVLQLDYVVAPGQYGGFSRAYKVFEDWSHHDTFNFWFYGLNTGGEFYVDLFDNRNHDVPGDTAERFTATFTDDVAGWRYIQLPFGDFTRKGWQPGGAPNDGLTLTEVWGFGFGLPAGTQGTIYLDEFVLQDTADLVVEKARVGTGDVTGGDRVTYTLSIANLGPTTPVTGTVVDTWTPVDAVTAVAAPSECTVELAAGKVTCTYAELDTAYLPKMLVFTTEARFSGELVNTASIEPLGDVVDVRPENDTSSVTVTVLFGGGDLYLPLVMRDYGP